LLLQQRYGTIAPMTPTVEAIRLRVNALFGIEFNHAVVLMYRNGDDCIGYHKDKTLDLDEDSPIISISLGVPRLYTLRDKIHNPTVQQEYILPHGALFSLGRQSNENFYHSIRAAESLECFGVMQTTSRISITFRRVLTFRDPEYQQISGKGCEYQTLNWPESLKGRHKLLSE
jgi:alkylated DNA repair dioxygenase AlkB